MFGSVRAWLRRHPRLVDGALVTPLALLSFPILFWSDTADTGSLPDTFVTVGGLCGPFVVRRERPLLAFAISALAAAGQWAADVSTLPANFVLLALLYNVASRCNWKWAAAAALVLELGAVLLAEPYVTQGAWGQLVLPMTIVIASIWVWGNSVRTRRAYLAGLEERAVRLERERDAQARIAAAAERARIARELHDVVSHSLGVMVVQADGAAYALEADPERSRQALTTISTTGRTALTEMRRMLGLLRDGADADARDGERGTGADTGPELAPQPGVAELDQLVAQVRRAGLPVEFHVDGVSRELQAGVELTAYRVVQEALTNSLKHAGPGVSGARVRLEYGTDTLDLRVSDDGRGAAAARDGQGHGLMGMRERVGMYGGSISSGPRDGGGYEVVASLPLEPE